MQNNDLVLICEEGSSLTHQEFKDDCDISHIMEQFQRVGFAKHITSSMEMFGDFSNIPDYQESLNIVIAAQDAFNEMPAQIRARFNNDPGTFVAFAQDENNRDEMIRLGMIDVSKSVQNLDKTVSSETATPTST